MIKNRLNVKGVQITYSKDYISLTDIAKTKSLDAPADVVKNWMRSKNTIEFLGIWERINNIDFKLVEFDQFWKEAGGNGFVLSPSKWIERTGSAFIILLENIYFRFNF